MMTRNRIGSLWTRFPFWCRFSVWILTPVLVVAIGGVAAMRGSLPATHGELTVARLNSEIQIARDAHSIPQIRAQSDRDALFGLGFVHAQDRLWQMEMDRRLAAGRLSEVLGERALPADRATRRLGLMVNAQRILAQLDAKDRDLLQAYVDGVNEGMRTLSSWPIEFQLLRHQPEAWRAEDSLLLMQWMAWQFSGNSGAEIERLLLLRFHGREVANALSPSLPADVEALVMQAQMPLDGQTRNAAADDLAQLARAGRETGLFNAGRRLTGSNGWVVAGRFSASRAPLLANDPHLSTPMPGLWYLADLRGDRLRVSGATLPGLPFVLIGRNSHIAWGMTNAKADTQDVVLEELNPLNRNQVRQGQRFVDLEIRREEIQVRAGLLRPPREPEILEVRRTANGPLISDIAGLLGTNAYSVRWTGDDDQGGSFSSLLNLAYASNWQEFESTLSSFVVPIHVFLYADTQGHIGLIAPGKYPVRARGDGSMPVASRGEAVWRGFLPYSAVPRQLDPASGLLVVANQKLTPAQDPDPFGNDYSPPYRADRIRAELERRIAAQPDGLTASDIAAIQLDLQAPVASNGVLAAMRALVPATERERRALDLLMGWDGAMRVDSPAAALSVSWTAHLNDLMLGAMRGHAAHGIGGADPLDARRYEDNAEFVQQLLTDPTQRWCRLYAGKPEKGCTPLMRDALNRAIEELTAQLGDDPARWRWGHLHKLRLAHFPFSKPRYQPYMPAVDELPLASLFDRELEVGGGNETVNFGATSFARGSRYLQFYGPQYRQVVDLAPGAPAWFMQATGQSGNPLSRHYDDLLDLHLQGRYLDMNPRSPKALLVLRPKAR